MINPLRIPSLLLPAFPRRSLQNQVLLQWLRTALRDLGAGWTCDWRDEPHEEGRNWTFPPDREPYTGAGVLQRDQHTHGRPTAEGWGYLTRGRFDREARPLLEDRWLVDCCRFMFSHMPAALDSAGHGRWRGETSLAHYGGAKMGSPMWSGEVGGTWQEVVP